MSILLNMYLFSDCSDSHARAFAFDQIFDRFNAFVARDVEFNYEKKRSELSYKYLALGVPIC